MEDLIKLVIVQSLYDFAVWYPFFEGKVGIARWKVYLYRFFQISLDFPITYLVMNKVLEYQFSYEDKMFWAFIVLKLGGVCDAFYLLWRYIASNKSYQEKDVDWWWWTFLGGFRSLVESLHYKNLQKGELTLAEFWAQSILTLVISFFIILIF